MNGRSTSGTTGLGTVEVSGRSRVPSPPTRITACIVSSPPDALVGEARGAYGVRVQRVAPIDHDPASHPLRDQPPVELQELRPLGDQDYGVSVAGSLQRRRGEVDAADQ